MQQAMNYSTATVARTFVDQEFPDLLFYGERQERQLRDQSDRERQDRLDHERLERELLHQIDRGRQFLRDRDCSNRRDHQEIRQGIGSAKIISLFDITIMSGVNISMNCHVTRK